VRGLGSERMVNDGFARSRASRCLWRSAHSGLDRELASVLLRRARWSEERGRPGQARDLFDRGANSANSNETHAGGCPPSNPFYHAQHLLDVEVRGSWRRVPETMRYRRPHDVRAASGWARPRPSRCRALQGTEDAPRNFAAVCEQLAEGLGRAGDGYIAERICGELAAAAPQRQSAHAGAVTRDPGGQTRQRMNTEQQRCPFVGLIIQTRVQENQARPMDRVWAKQRYCP
jgi:hypothetical protein